jgi:hypothetical protein
MAIGFVRFQDGIIYRALNMKAVGGADSMHKYVVNKGIERIDLADIVIPGGYIRVDRVRLPYSNELHLGHYALPHFDGGGASFEVCEIDGFPVGIASRPERKVAMTAIRGWEGLRTANHNGLNPEAPKSTVIHAVRTVDRDYCGMELMVTVMLHRIDDGDWSDDELQPVLSCELLPYAPSGQPCGARLILKDGREITIDFGNIEGNLT